MSRDQQKRLNQTLEAYDLAGMPFFEAKQRLVEEGYSDDEIGIAVASSPFDGKKSHKKPANPITKIYAKNPRLAKDVADSLLKHEANMRKARIRAAAAGMSVPFVGINPVSARAASNLSHELGFPLLRLLLLGFLGAIALLQLGVDVSTALTIAQYYIFGIGSILLLLLIRSEVRNRRRTTGAGSQIPWSLLVLILVVIATMISMFVLTP